MKKLFTIGFLLSFLFVTFAPLSASAQDCSGSIDAVCRSYKGIAQTIDKCRYEEDLNRMDFMELIYGSEIGRIPDSCASYKLTSEDKRKMRDAFKEIHTSMINKLTEFYGASMKASIEKDMQWMMETYDEIEEESPTLGSYLKNLDDLQD